MGIVSHTPTGSCEMVISISYLVYSIVNNFNLSLFSGPEFDHVFTWLKGEIDNYAHTLIMQCDFKITCMVR